MIPEGTYLYSVGHLAQLFQMATLHVSLAFEDLGIGPAIVLNDVAYFRASDVLTLRADLEKDQNVRRSKV